MFALDLFNTDHERRLAEGAVDKLEQRRIDDLAMKMDELVARARQIKDPAHKAALMKEFQKCKAERESYFKIKDECMGYGTLVGEQGIPGNLPPEQIPGKEDLLKGKGRQTYESEIDESFGPVGSKALMNGNMATFMKARASRQPVTLDIGGEQFRLTPALMDAMAKKYGEDKTASDADPTNRDLKIKGVNNYRAFGYPDLMRKFIDSVATPTSTPAAGEEGPEQLSMFEKKSNPKKKYRDTVVSREIQKARAAYPSADSDVEALVKREIETDNKQDLAIANLDSENKELAQKINAIVPGAKQTTAAGTPAPTTSVSATPSIPSIPNIPTVAPTAVTPEIPGALPTTLPEPEEMPATTQLAKAEPTAKQPAKVAKAEPEKTKKTKTKSKNTKINYRPARPRATVARQPAPQLQDPNVIDVDAQTLIPGLDSYNFTPITPVGQQTAQHSFTENNVDEGLIDAITDYVGDMYRGEQGAVVADKAVNKIVGVDESHMSELDAMRQDLERMNDRQFFTAYGISKAAFKQKYRALLNPAQQQDTPVEEGFQDFNTKEPYAVCLAGKPVKQFDYYEEARRFHDNWKKKLYREGNKEKADKITLMPIMDEGTVGQGSWIVYDPATKEIKKRFKTHTAGKSYAKTHGLGFASAEYYFDNVKQQAVAEEYEDDWYDDEPELDNGSYVVDTQDSTGEVFRVSRYEPGARRCWIGDRNGRGWFISPDRLEIVDDPSRINRYFGKKRDLDEESSTSSESAERAILNRIMVAHLDLLKQFGPQKVMQAVEEVAYNVGDLDEIGTSDVSAWVNEVKQILGVPEELDEKWSEKYKRSIDCSHPKGFSQRAHCAGRKK
jgi:hypothetical protein